MDYSIIGLDIGIASVGWALVQQDKSEAGKIINLGVRCFDKAENPKTGEPLSLARRLQRNTRNRLAHRAKRLKQLRSYLKQQGLIASDHADALVTPAHAIDPWQLRVMALDQQLDDQQLARVIYHLVKHRGYYVARKVEEDTSDSSEQGRMNIAVKATAQLFKDRHYRTVAELVLNEPDFQTAKRNKAGDYHHTFYRQLLKEELELILHRQQKLGNAKVSDDFITKIITDFFWYQRPALSGEAILNMLGHCLHEPDEFRAAKCSYSAERFVWLSNLNNLRISEPGGIRSLTESERRVLIDLPYRQEKITYKVLRTVLKKFNDFSQDSYFTGVTGKTEAELSKAELKLFFHAKGYHALRQAFSEQRWRQMSQDTALLDQLATILTLYKTDAEISQNLIPLKLQAQEITQLLKLSFSEFNHLSLKALHKLIPHLEVGRNYYEACELCGYIARKKIPKQRYLPPLYSYEFDKRLKKTKRIAQIRNPVVMRTLNQARQVLNEIIHRYGAPSEVHIELARELSETFQERQKIEKQQQANRLLKEALREEISQLKGEQQINNKDVLKYRLYKEQNGICAYSLKPLEWGRLLEEEYVTIDHILPYSRSFDDSLNNKVLVLSVEKQNKTNQTPYEYLNGAIASESWQHFAAWTRSNAKYPKAKKERLLRKNFAHEAAKEFAARNLNDTRYITRYIAQSIRDHLLFANNAPSSPVLTLSGSITGLLKTRWGLLKERTHSDLYHALDACVVAVASHSLLSKVAEFSYQQEMYPLIKADKKKDSHTGKIETDRLYFPKPWPTFREEVIARLAENPSQQIMEYKLPNYSQHDLAHIKPVFISRMPKRRNSGALHQESIRSSKFLHNQQSAIRKPLTSLRLADLDKIVGRFLADGITPDPRNVPLIEALRERLEDNQGDAKRAFAEPFYKPNREGKPTQLVRTVKVLDVQKGGVKIRGGIADQDTMWRVDVFEKEGKYYLVPLYQIDRQPNRALPNKAATAGKMREEWLEMDASYHFKFSLCLNDGVYLKNKRNEYRGYFAGLDIATAAISIRSHDNNSQIGRRGLEGLWRSIGVKKGIEQFEKLHVDILGNYYPAKKEIRYGQV